jgi:hypothetical protein
MSLSELEDELSYHLRELHADLTLTRTGLETAVSTDLSRSVVRAWGSVESLLAHDLEVHLPRALALLGMSFPPDDPFQPPAHRDAESHTSVASKAGKLIELALTTLPTTGDPGLTAQRLKETASIVQAAHHLVTGMQEAVMEAESLTIQSATTADD